MEWQSFGRYTPNLMQLVYDNSRTRQSRQVEVTEHVEQKSEMELFEEFYEIQNNQPMSEEQQDFVRELMEELVHCKFLKK